jgi:vesicle-fusing ATPase
VCNSDVPLYFNFVSGMLLFGPPGTGKTLIARQIGKLLGGIEPIVINGPEILSKFVGESESNMRKAFEPAIKDQKDKGDNSDLHIIIFDEIDAICKQRGSTGGGAGGAVHDTVVNTLLTMLDGVNSLNNILVIGMTNRKDMIDVALLRPGRLEIHLEISLPDEKGRRQIFDIHTKPLYADKKVARDVDLDEMAAVCKNFSGAEIEGLVRSAASFALYAGVDTSGGGAKVAEDIDYDAMQITRAHFMQAREECTAAFGADEEDISANIAGGFIEYNPSARKLFRDGKTLMSVVKESPRTPLISLLLEGTHGAGKTALACKLALSSEFPFIKLVHLEDRAQARMRCNHCAACN